MIINRKSRYCREILCLLLTDNTGFSLNAFSELQNQQVKTKKGPFGEDHKIIVEPNRIEDLAKNDHIALLKWSMETYQKRVRDYTGTFLKQERIKGKLKKTEQIAIMFKEKPFSVFKQ